jgi:hypothetical protein
MRNAECGLRNGNGFRVSGPQRGCLALALFFLFLSAPASDAAYRLTFKNGTSVEVSTYEDLGDSVRYPRLGGTVVVPKASLSAIEEAVHLPAPSPPVKPAAPPAPASAARTVRPESPAPRHEPPVSLPFVLPWQRAGDTALTVGTVRLLGGVAVLLASIAAVLFFIPRPSERRAGGTHKWHPAMPEAGPGSGPPGRPLGVVLIGIYDVVCGGAALSLGLTGVWLGELIGELPVFLIPVHAPLAVTVLSLATAGLGAVVLSAAYGMWTLQAWGRRLQAVLCVVDIPLETFLLFATHPTAGSLLGVAALLIDGAILVYIGRPTVRALYADDALDVDDAGVAEIEEERFTPSL